MEIHNGHRARKKDLYRRLGLRGMAEHEVLELVLFYGIPRRDTNILAHRLIEQFGSLENVLHAPVETLTQVEGIGENAALLLRLVGDIRYYTAAQPRKNVRLNSVRACGKMALRLLAGEQRELLYQFCIDSKGVLMETYLLSRGTLSSASVQVQQVVENALACRCDSVVLAHNHPGGVALASGADIATTNSVKAALELLGIHLADHIIVADNDYVSMLQSLYID